MSSPLSLAQSLVTTRVVSSKFIDTPSGLLNLALKKFTHTNLNNFQYEHCYLKVELHSRVARERLSAYSGQTGVIKESYETERLGFYRVEKPSLVQQLKGSTDTSSKAVLSKIGLGS